MRLFLFIAILGIVAADIYMHNPRGSNNRLNENSANRNNANRLFDSQNNNRGGYNVGDSTASKSNNEGQQYRMKYFQSGPEYLTLENNGGRSLLTFEWTNQHGCGGNEDTDPHKQNCNLVFQYMCQPDVDSATGTTDEDVLRNGQSTATQDYNKPNSLDETENTANNRRSNVVKLNKGYQEPWSWYDSCVVRERNRGLFTADQKLKSNNGLGYSAAIYTRQNPNGNRRGYECPEERDYYPYWHPTPWKDIAVLAENSSICTHYQNKSFNVQPYHECVEYWPNTETRKHYSRWNNQAECTANGGTWTPLYNFLEKAPVYTSKAACEGASGKWIKYIWQVPYDSTDGTSEECLVALPTPECKEAPWSRSNHLGNSRDGVTSNFTWTLPYFPSGNTLRCVVRLRYNISTDDYDPYHTNATHNKNIAQGIKSPVEQNPYVEVGAGTSPLRLAINTAQFGRTFQDRNHVFKLRPRPAGTEQSTIYNLNVRGKRGNIVQVYPAVEYDFAPSELDMSDGDLVHIQWTGSNTHNNGNPGGDGQTGDAGEGTGGTDRSNIVQVVDLNTNYPLPMESTNMWSEAEVKWIHHDVLSQQPKDLAINMASAGYYVCVQEANCGDHGDQAAETKNTLNILLNNAPASYEGALVKFKKGTYHYICTRNNNFTNRSQKGTIIVQ